MLNLGNVTVWRHVDKTGPEGNIDAFMHHGQGDFVIAVELTDASLPLLKVKHSFSFSCVPDAVLVVGNGRLLRSWDANIGGLNWEVVLDTGR